MSESTGAAGAPQEVDVVVVGLGPGGEHVAQSLAQAGLRVVGVEKRLVGGECPYYGCIPSKMMLRAADTLAEARRVDALAGHAEVHPDYTPVARRISEEATDDWDDAVAAKRLTDAGVEVLRGTGRLDGAGTVVVTTEDGERRITATRGVVLNSGTDPAELPIDGLAGTPYWTNREAVSARELPASLTVIGGGPIGCELTQVFARFGVEVTLLEVGERILGPEEPESSALLAQVLTEEGVTIHTGVEIQRVRHHGAGFSVTLAGGREITSEQLLVAAGRRLAIRDVGLETVGLDPTARSIEVDERMRAGDRLWAIGDITGKGAFTHVSMYQGDVVIRDVLDPDGQDGHGFQGADYRAVARVTFTDPEVGSVGLSEKQAREAGLRVLTAHTDLSSSSRGWLHGPGGVGLIKLVADADRGVLVGASSMGPTGGEVLGLLALAVHAEVPLATLGSMHYAFPTMHRAISTVVADLQEQLRG